MIVGSALHQLRVTIDAHPAKARHRLIREQFDDEPPKDPYTDGRDEENGQSWRPSQRLQNGRPAADWRQGDQEQPKDERDEYEVNGLHATTTAARPRRWVPPLQPQGPPAVPKQRRGPP